MSDVEIALLWVGMHMSLRNIAEASLAQKALNGLFWSRDGWALHVFMHVFRAHGQTANIERQATRGPISGRGLIGQACFHQTVGDHLLEITRSLALHTSRDFFGKEFEQQIRHNNYSPSRLRLKPPASVNRNASPH